MPAVRGVTPRDDINPDSHGLLPRGVAPAPAPGAACHLRLQTGPTYLLCPDPLALDLGVLNLIAVARGDCSGSSRGILDPVLRQRSDILSDFSATGTACWLLHTAAIDRIAAAVLESLADASAVLKPVSDFDLCDQFLVPPR